MMEGRDVVRVIRYWSVGISFGCSMLAAASSGEPHSQIWIWDVPSGTHLHTIGGESRYFIPVFRWSRIDLRLAVWFNKKGGPRYFNTKTFQEEVLSDPGDRFRKCDRLQRQRNILRIGSKGPLFLALPSHLDPRMFHCHADRVSILSKERQLFLLDISGLDTYMKEFCRQSRG